MPSANNKRAETRPNARQRDVILASKRVSLTVRHEFPARILCDDVTRTPSHSPTSSSPFATTPAVGTHSVPSHTSSPGSTSTIGRIPRRVTTRQSLAKQFSASFPE